MKKIKIITLFLALAACCFLLTTYTHAQQAVKLTVSPPNQEVSVKPGMQTRVQVKFFNSSTENMAGYIKIADFIVTDKYGGPDLLNISAENNRFSASSWLSVSEDRVSIPPNTPYTSTVFINVPEKVSGCGHYAAVYFEPIPAGIGDKKSAAGVSFKLPSLISFTVEGKCTEKAYVNKIEVPSFIEYGPIPISVEVLNRSDYHISPQGYVNISNLLNRQAGVEELPKHNVFPDAIRRYDLELGSKWMFGRYKISLNAAYGKTGQAITGFTYAWVFPWRVVLVIILSAIALILIINHLYKRIVVKESVLEKEIEKEKEEIEKLKKQLRKKDN